MAVILKLQGKPHIGTIYVLVYLVVFQRCSVDSHTFVEYCVVFVQKKFKYQ